MSTSSATATQAVVAAPERLPRRPVAATPRLRILPPPSTPRVVRARAPKAPFVILVSLLLAGGLVGLLLLNTLVDQDAFRLHALRAGQSGLDVQEAQLRQTADDDADPAALAARAATLGMVPAGPPTFVREAKLPKGKRVGNLIVVAGPAPKTTAPAVAITPSAAPSAAAMGTVPSQAAPSTTPSAATPSTSASTTPSTKAAVTKATAAKTTATKTRATKTRATKTTAAKKTATTKTSTTTTSPQVKASAPAAAPSTAPSTTTTKTGTRP